MNINPISYLVALLLGMVAIFASAAEQQLPKSKALLEQRVQELKDESRQLSVLRPELTKLLDTVRQAEQCVANIRVPTEADVSRASVEIKTAWGKVLSAKAGVILDKGNAEFDALAAAYKSTESLGNPAARCLDPLPVSNRFGIERLIAGDQSRPNPKINSLVLQYLSKFLQRNQANGFPEELGGFLSDFVDEGFTRAKLNQSQSELVSRAIEGLSKRLSEVTELNSQLRASLKELSSATERELATAKLRSEEIDKSLSELDDRLSIGSAATDKQLIIAVYLMIGALLVLFLGIKFLENSIALKIVENRSLVEVVSMAFLLLTIIILGTGEKMPKEAIGTLLGSIAGYIFGRKISDSGA